jgi:hypothetical protein
MYFINNCLQWSDLGLNFYYIQKNLCLIPNLLRYGGFRDIAHMLMLRNGAPYHIRYPACFPSVTFRLLLHISANLRSSEA